MEIKKILLTGDDGYNARGVRVLAAILKDKYDLQILATKTQQSGVGGKISSTVPELAWGEDVVDGVGAVWVDGTPVDAMEFGAKYFEDVKFDLIISGINWGQNLGFTSLTTSGTYMAALRGIGIGLAPRGISMSMGTSAGIWSSGHGAESDVARFIGYPGKAAAHLLNESIAHEFWNSALLNINFPKSQSMEYQLTTLSTNLRHQYSYDMVIDKDTHKWYWPKEMYSKERDSVEDFDTYAFDNGVISVTPITL